MSGSVKQWMRHAHSTPDPDDTPAPEPAHIPQEVPQPDPPPVQEPDPPPVPIKALWRAVSSTKRSPCRVLMDVSSFHVGSRD